MTKPIFQLIILEEAKKFLDSLPIKVVEKIIYNVDRIANGEKNKELFKKLDNTNIWEFRTHYNKTAYRLFAFWDKEKETLVIATHGFIKKTQKTPSREIAKAEAIRKEYLNTK